MVSPLDIADFSWLSNPSFWVVAIIVSFGLVIIFKIRGGRKTSPISPSSSSTGTGKGALGVLRDLAFVSAFFLFFLLLLYLFNTLLPQYFNLPPYANFGNAGFAFISFLGIFIVVKVIFRVAER